MTANTPSTGLDTTTGLAGGSPKFQVAPGANLALTLLLLINLFNYIDRQVLSANLTAIEHAFLPSDGEWNKTLMGLLAMAFMVAYMVFAPLFGYLADRMKHWTLVGIGVILWSLASGASGLSGMTAGMLGFWLLLATRCFVGVGEAAYGPVAPTLISDLYPERMRGQVMSWFYLAIPVGSALGYTLGGWAGWPWSFYLVVPPGLLLGALCFLMKEPRRGQVDFHEHPAVIFPPISSEVAPGRPAEAGTPTPGPVGVPASAGFPPSPDRIAKARPARRSPPEHPTVRHVTLKDYWLLFRTPSYVLNTLGMTCLTFALGGIAIWMPHFATEYRNAGSQESVNTTFGLIVVVSGLISTLLGGLAGDFVRRYTSGAYFLVSAVAMFLAFPLFLWSIYAPFPLAWVLIFCACFLLFFNTGPTNTILANVTHPSLRPAGFALNIFIIHALGDAVSPVIIGWIADLHKVDGKADLALGFVAVSGMILLGGIFWLIGIRYLGRDTERAIHQLAEPRAVS
jgi:MFS family permease